jgi:hypothetical protein
MGVLGRKKEKCNEEHHNLYSSPKIRMIKSKRMRWVGHVACMEEMKMHTKF